MIAIIAVNARIATIAALTVAALIALEDYRGEQSEFLNACKEEGGSSKYCDCYRDNTMEKFPRYEEASNISFEEAVEIAKECE